LASRWRKVDNPSGSPFWDTACPTLFDQLPDFDEPTDAWLYIETASNGMALASQSRWGTQSVALADMALRCLWEHGATASSAFGNPPIEYPSAIATESFVANNPAQEAKDNLQDEAQNFSRNRAGVLNRWRWLIWLFVVFENMAPLQALLLVESFVANNPAQEAKDNLQDEAQNIWDTACPTLFDLRTWRHCKLCFW
jgi:hypothetical protein